MNAVSMEASRGCQFPWNCVTDGFELLVMWVLGINLAASALNC